MGTDTHLWGLMFGAILAFAMQDTVIGSDEPTRSRLSGQWGTAGWLALAGVVAAGLAVPDSVSMYPWGMVGASLLALLVILAVLPDVQSRAADLLRTMLGSRILSWLGVRSYGIYLWHWPLYVLLYYQLPTLNTYAAALAVLISSIFLAHLSYRYVEDPIRRMGFKNWVLYQSRRIRRFSAPAAISTVAVPLAVVGFAVAGIAVGPAMSSGQQAVVEGQGSDYDGRESGKGMGAPRTGGADDSPTGDSTALADEPEETPAPEETAAERPPEPSPDAGTAAPTPEPTPEPSVDTVPVPPTSWDQVTIIGDSVVLAAKYRLEETMPGAIVDAEESRSIKAAPQLISQHAARGTLGDYVVVSLATNGVITDADIDAIMTAVGEDRTVVFVTAFGPARASWIPGSNESIASAPDRYPGRAYIADWHAAIEDHTDLLAGDVIHPGREGAAIYAETIRKTLNPTESPSPTESPTP